MVTFSQIGQLRLSYTGIIEQEILDALIHDATKTDDTDYWINRLKDRIAIEPYMDHSVSVLKRYDFYNLHVLKKINVKTM